MRVVLLDNSVSGEGRGSLLPHAEGVPVAEAVLTGMREEDEHRGDSQS